MATNSECVSLKAQN